ncbi:hypothetical protein [Streptomyces sp. NPDC101776]|uniref:hypothetical protein n=1 Tax=Streptomyces sp. NPDC101776 TaxID=3366146 RepID=UPI0038188121
MDRMQEYIDAIPPRHRPLFARVSGLILKEFPQANVALLYEIPTSRVEKRRLPIAAHTRAGRPADDSLYTGAGRQSQPHF